MSDPQVIIIGAGIAGLAAGCYAQASGISSLVLEQHTLPGGLCTSWRRKGFVFDGAVRYLSGLPGSSTDRSVWEELDLLTGQSFYYYDEFLRYEGTDGRSLHWYTDIDRLEEHLLDLAPGDAGAIRDLAEGVRGFRRLNLPTDLTPTGPREYRDMGQRMLPALGPLLRWRSTTTSQFAARLNDPLLRSAIPALFQFAPADFPMLLLLTTLAALDDREAAYPLGGSLHLAEHLAARYHALGGQLRYRARVSEILTRDDRAVGVRLDDGSELSADVVISAADGYSTIFRLLAGRHVDERVRGYYGELAPSSSILQVSLGLDRDLSAEPPALSFPLAQAVYLGNMRHHRLVAKHYCFDPSMAPAGKSVITVWCDADYDYWQAMRRHLPHYRAAKELVGQQVIAALDERYPGLAGAVEVLDVATPMTYERYTGNWRGAFAGWAMTTRKMSMMMGQAMSKTLPGLEAFYMIGQWVEPGGNTELSAASGRDVIKLLCAQTGRTFRTPA